MIRTPALSGSPTRLSCSPHPLNDIVTELTRQCAALWEGSSRSLATHGRVFSRAEQARREKAAEDLLRRFASTKPTRRESTSRVIALVAEMDEEVATEQEICRALLRRMADVGEQFTRDARRFDETLPDQSLAQALRNLWVMNSIQVFCGRPVILTPSCFAYSLLYPYTDNLLDNPQLSDSAKRSFVHRLGTRLEGQTSGKTGSAQEERIWRLIHEIEREWPRQRYPLVYQSLLAIHEAQRNSLLLHRVSSPIPPEHVLQLTFTKGGTSVLAHGFLVQGSLTEEACGWIFGFGSVLQMVDDLQDLAEDRASGHTTVFTGCHTAQDLPIQINRLLGYAGRVAADFPEPSTPEQRILLRLIRGSCLVLVCEAVASMRSLIPPSYAALLEHRSPLSFTCLRSLRHRTGDLLTSKSLDMFRRTSGAAAIRPHMERAL